MTLYWPVGPARHGWRPCGIALSLTLLLGSAVVRAQPPVEIEYASPDQSVWTTRRDAQGQPDNPLFRVAKQLFAKAGIPWRGRTYPAVRMFKNLQDGSSQFSILVKSPALHDCCLLSQAPIAAAEIRAYHLAQHPAPRELSDLAGQSVIVVHGYSYGGLLRFFNDARHNVTVHAAMTHESAFKMLERGRADYVIDYAGPGSEVLAENPVAGVQSVVLSRQDVYLVLSRSYPEAPSVMRRLEHIASTLNVGQILADATKSNLP
jgi:ABC-type amino acid transport substrate-binding protein